MNLIQSVVTALRFVGVLLLILLGVVVGLVVAMWSFHLLGLVDVTSGAASMLNLAFGVLLFMLSLGILAVVWVGVETLGIRKK